MLSIEHHPSLIRYCSSECLSQAYCQKSVFLVIFTGVIKQKSPALLQTYLISRTLKREHLRSGKRIGKVT
jgi:hypothetical protein